ncbi:MAG: hypothetical protein AB7E30_09220 [Lawsonibacter sp.]
MLEEKIEVQDHKIKKLQALITEEGMFSQIIHCCPYPIAVFVPDGRLVMKNEAFLAHADTGTLATGSDTLGIPALYFARSPSFFRAAKQVFSGKTFFLEYPDDPASVFCGMQENERGSPAERFGKAIMFPVTDGDGKVTQGVLVLVH